MPDEKDQQQQRAAQAARGGSPGDVGGRPSAGAAETATTRQSREVSSDQPSARGQGQQLSGADRDAGQRTGTRTGGTTDAMAEEFIRLGIDARLDNRLGDQRPHLAEHLKPQQFSGPEVGYYGEHADENREAFAAATGQPAGEMLGSRSLGQLGRGEEISVEDERASVQPQSK